MYSLNLLGKLKENLNDEIVLSSEFTRRFEHNLMRLAKLIDSSSEIKIQSIPTNIIELIILKFKNEYNSKEYTLTRKELRTLSFSIDFESNNTKSSIIHNTNELNEFLSLLDKNWKDSFLTGLLLIYFRNFSISRPNKKSFDSLNSFILNKISNYKGNKKPFLFFKKNTHYLNPENGNLVLGVELVKNNIPINKIPETLFLNNSWFSLEYFSEVILTYYEKKKSKLLDFIDEIENTITIHGDVLLTKRLISRMILDNEFTTNDFLLNKIKFFAIKFIGDPNHVNWNNFEGTSNDKINFNKARLVLNTWLIKIFITVFFDTCINDTRRKMFWLNYASKIQDFRVFGPQHQKELLLNDPRIKKQVNLKFQTVSSNVSKSAFVMMINNHKLIEFSDPGYAFYGYLNSNLFSPKIDYKGYTSVDDFRNGSMNIANSGGFLSEEGRLFHRDGWENNFAYWLKKIVKC